MFWRAMKLILAASTKPFNDRDSGLVQEDTIANLKVLKKAKCPYDCPQVTDPCIRFASGEAWSLLYLWLAFTHRWPANSITEDALTTIETSLKQHFEAIQEEFSDV